MAAAIMYTDLVDSTALTTSVPASEAERIRHEHFRLLGEAIVAHGGEEVKKLGDGIMAVFWGSSAALDAATAMQQAIVRHNRVDQGPPLSIRIGISTGDCVTEDGDYFGEPAIQAARLCAACRGDQILVASVVGLLVPRDAHSLTPIGDLDLKGIPEPFPTLELSWAPPEHAAPGTDAIPMPGRLAAETGLSALIGRTAERQVLADAFKGAHAGERRVVLITGEAGLGKTRLTAEFAAEAFATGAAVLYGRCDEELAVPYLPWVESIGHLVEHVDEGIIDSIDDGTRAHLARVLPRFGARTDRSHAPDVDAMGDRYALFSSVSRILRAACAEQTVVVVLDDLHWADPGTLQLLEHVATSLPRARLLIIGTYRETDLGATDPLTETSARLHRVAGVDRMQLVGLSDDAVVELLADAAGHDLDAAAVQLGHVLRADTAGNPFFVLEVIRHLVETGSITQQDGRWAMAHDLDDLALPQSVRDVVGQRVRRLGAEAHAVLSAAAVVGREFDTAVVAGAADLDEDLVLDVLEEALNAGLVMEVQDTVDRFSFTHALVQHTLYGELTGSRRARMHRRVAECLEELASPEPGEVAKHLFAAVRPAELDRAIAYAIQAGERALSSAAPDDAVRWFAQAYETLEDSDPNARCEVQVALGDAERQAGREIYRERLLQASERAVALGRGDLLIKAVLANNRGWHSASGEVDHERVAMLELALEQPEAVGANRARILATLAAELTYTDDARRFDMAQESEELGRATGEPAVLLDALERVAGSINVPEMLPERQRRAEQMLELTADGRDPIRRFLALEQHSDVCLALADMDAARRCLDERLAIAERLGQPTFLWLVTNTQALLHFVEGDIEAAASDAERAFEMGTASGQPDVMTYFGGMLMQIHMHRNQYAEIIPLVRDRVESLPGLSAARAVLVNFLTHTGEHEEPRRRLAEEATGGFSFNRDLVWLTSTALFAEAAALLGDLDSAALLHERLLPFGDQVICTRAYCIGPASYYLGVVERALGRPEAEQSFRDAAARSGDLRAPFHRARAAVALAETIRSTAPSEAASFRDEAMAVAQQFDMPGVRSQAESLSF